MFVVLPEALRHERDVEGMPMPRLKRTSEFRAIAVHSFSNCSPEMPKHLAARFQIPSEYLSVGVYVSAHRGKNVFAWIVCDQRATAPKVQANQ